MGTDLCRVCKCGSFGSCLKHANNCNVTQKGANEYAAVDSAICFGSLPFLDHHELKSPVPQEQVSCVDPSLWVVSTLLVVLGSYPGFSNIIHMGCPEGVPSGLLLDASMSLQQKEQKGSGVCVTRVGATDDEYDVMMYGNPVVRRFRKRELVQFLSLVLESSGAMCWYWDNKLKWCTSTLHGADGNMWITLNGGDSSRHLNYVGVGGSRTMQCFYSHFEENRTLTINTGSGLASALPKGDDRLFLASVVRDLVNSVSKDGKCYFCAYVCSIHEKIHSGASTRGLLGTLALSPALKEVLDF